MAPSAADFWIVLGPANLNKAGYVTTSAQRDIIQEMIKTKFTVFLCSESVSLLLVLREYSDMVPSSIPMEIATEMQVLKAAVSPTNTALMSKELAAEAKSAVEMITNDHCFFLDVIKQWPQGQELLASIVTGIFRKISFLNSDAQCTQSGLLKICLIGHPKL